MATIDEIREKIAEAVAKNDEAKAIMDGTGQAVETAASAAAQAEAYRDEILSGMSPCTEQIVSGSTAVLHQTVVYEVRQSGELDLRGLTVAENATAEIRVLHDGNTILFPDAWVWGDSIFMKSLPTPQGAPAMVAGQWYSFYVSAHPTATLISTGIIVAP